MKSETVGVILAHLIITIVVYLLFSFIYWQIDASQWDSWDRFVAVLAAIYLNVLAAKRNA